LPRNTAPRFFVDATLAEGKCIDLPTAVAHHAQRVLRLSEGDPITLFNGRGGEYAASLLSGNRASIARFDPVERVSRLHLTLIQALIAIDKLDWVIEKAVELGVASIVVSPATRSVVRLEAERLKKRLLRWNELVVAACCQCGRNRLMSVAYASDLDTAFAAADAERKLVLAPDAATDLSSCAAGSVAMAVGPEGGFTPDEIESAQRCGFTPVFLGPRVMRTETAGLAAAAALQALHGDIGLSGN
jgi:16S rRNA (uracil1498-N3)-methyltransferase